MILGWEAAGSGNRKPNIIAMPVTGDLNTNGLQGNNVQGRSYVYSCMRGDEGEGVCGKENGVTVKVVFREEWWGEYVLAEERRCNGTKIIACMLNESD
jgi:hypothetical protein